MAITENIPITFLILTWVSTATVLLPHAGMKMMPLPDI